MVEDVFCFFEMLEEVDGRAAASSDMVPAVHKGSRRCSSCLSSILDQVLIDYELGFCFDGRRKKPQKTRLRVVTQEEEALCEVLPDSFHTASHG